MLSLFAYPAMLKYVEAIALFVNVYPTTQIWRNKEREIAGWITEIAKAKGIQEIISPKIGI